MYIPNSFEVTDKIEIFEFIESNSFGQLISLVEGQHFSTHMPFLVSSDKKHIIGHIAKQNPQHLEIEGQKVLITFLGPHEYISPSWYASAGVPTWNYQAVHIYGNCKIISNQETVKSVIDSMTHKYESNFNEPWKPTYNESLLELIVGLEIEITEIQCKFKLGQNRSILDQKQVAEKLASQGSLQMARAMQVKAL